MQRDFPERPIENEDCLVVLTVTGSVGFGPEEQPVNPWRVEVIYYIEIHRRVQSTPAFSFVFPWPFFLFFVDQTLIWVKNF